jgi:hypothetical protein
VPLNAGGGVAHVSGPVSFIEVGYVKVGITDEVVCSCTLKETIEIIRMRRNWIKWFIR